MLYWKRTCLCQYVTISPYSLYRYDDPEIIAGQGTIGLEILEQLSEVDYLVIPVG